MVKIVVVLRFKTRIKLLLALKSFYMLVARCAAHNCIVRVQYIAIPSNT